MVTPERAAEVIKLFAPLVVGVLLLTYGIFRQDAAVIALGAGAIGLPGMSGTLSAHRKEGGVSRAATVTVADSGP